MSPAASPTRQTATRNLFRQWEAAGTSHFDTYGLLIGPSDTGNGQGAVANLAAMQNPTDVPGPGGLCTQPINTGGAHWLLDSAIYCAEPVGHQRHATSERAAPADHIDVAVRLREGRATATRIGGVRTPQVDAPIATLAGIGNTRRQDRDESHLGVLSALRLNGALHTSTSWRRCTRTTASSCRPGATTSRRS